MSTEKAQQFSQSIRFVGRDDEMKYIMEAAETGEASMLVVYGRI